MNCGWSRRARLRRRLPFVAITVALTTILYVFLPSPAVPFAGALAVLLLVLPTLRAHRFAGGPGGRPPGGGPAGVREPRRPRPNPPAGSMAMAVPVPLLAERWPDDDATEVAWA